MEDNASVQVLDSAEHAGEVQHPDTIGIAWPIPLQHRTGLPGFTGGIDIYYDFDWVQTIGHRHGKFPNCKDLSHRARKECREDKTPALLLTTRDDITATTHVSETHRVVVVNFDQLRQAPSATEFFANITDVPLRWPRNDGFQREKFYAALAGAWTASYWFGERYSKVWCRRTGL